jgi:hypothetical protein
MDAGISDYRVSMTAVRSFGGLSAASLYVAGYIGNPTHQIQATGALGSNVTVLCNGVYFHSHTTAITDSNTTAAVVLGTHVDTDVVQDFKHPKDLAANGGYRHDLDGWFQTDVPANQTTVQLGRFGDTAGTTSRYSAIRSGSVTGLWARSSEARTAGSCTVFVFKNGVSTGMNVAINASNTTFDHTFQAKDAITFVATDQLDLRVSTSADWAPTTADLTAGMEIET